MANIQISVDMEDAQKKLEVLNGIKGGAPKATMRAMNKTAAGMKTDAAREVSARYTIAQKHYKKKLEVRRATMQELAVTMSAKDRGIRSTYFNFKPNEDPGVEGAPTVRVRYKKGGSFTRESRKYGTGGFIATVPSGLTGAFARKKGKRRTNFEAIYGPGVVQMLNNEQISTTIQDNASERFTKALDHEIKYLLDTQKG